MSVMTPAIDPNDPLYSLSALVWHTKKGMPISDEAAKAINQNAAMLCRADPIEALALLRVILFREDIGETMLRFAPVFGTLFPDLLPTIGFNQHTRWHAHTLYVHISHVVNGVKPDFITRFSAVLHDNGKTHTVSVENKEDGSFVYHFPEHPRISAELAKPVLKRYGIDGDEAKEILFLIGRHDHMIAPTPKSVRKILDRIQKLELGHPLDTLSRLLDIQTSDHADHTTLVPIPSREILQIAREILAETGKI